MHAKSLMDHQQHRPPSKNQLPEHFWPKSVIRKWLNRSAKSSEFSADPEDEDSSGESEVEEESCAWPKSSRIKDKHGYDFQSNSNGAFPRSRRRKSETFRAQYIEAKELKVSVNTWNVGGKHPPEDLDVEDWLNVANPADIYVIGFQEIIPLNAGNIFGTEDTRPIPVWENIIRGTLNRVQHEKTKFKYYSNPSSPSRFQPSDDVPDIEEEVVLESDSEGEEEIHPFNEESNFDELMDGPAAQNVKNMSMKTSDSNDNWLASMEAKGDLERRRLARVNCFPTQDSEENVTPLAPANNRKLTRILSATERIGLCWPEPPLDLLAQCVSERPTTLKTIKSFKASKSFKHYNTFKSYMNTDNRIIPEVFLRELDLDSTMYRKRRSPYVRIVSKQMVGIFITVWVRRRLRKYIQNVHVSAVGVGVGSLGNKGSISVRMSIYQTFFCFICTHLTSGERDTDIAKRNADVHEIHKKTRFSTISNSTLPERIYNHDRIIWLGDLNYRLNSSYEMVRDLISKNEWPKLLECDQLVRELRKGHAFDGWSEGVIEFPPTYKYEQNSEKYCGEDPKVGRRIPSWCDRILSFGKGIRQLSYRRTENKFSDHRPVAATYMIEVEVFSPRKLQKALTITNAEIENDGMIAEMGVNGEIKCLRLPEVSHLIIHRL